jgi:hypothetical protein
MLTFDEYCDSRRLSPTAHAAFGRYIGNTQVRMSPAMWDKFYDEYLGWLAQAAGNEA